MSFTGVRLKFLDIDLNSFNGFGVTLLNVSYDISKVITISKGGSLFFISAKKHFDYGGIEWKLHLNLLFTLRRDFVLKTIKPKRNSCWECGNYFDHTPYSIGKNNEMYCSKHCAE